ncbi:MAG: hypothetical protein GEV07_09670 [Streptosporangiales bacterium]|nr:hypothetical protein [Streptosporangiales bacterium]
MSGLRTVLACCCALVVGAGVGVTTAAFAPAIMSGDDQQPDVARVAGLPNRPPTPQASPGSDATELHLEPNTPLAVDAGGDLLLVQPPRTTTDQASRLLRVDKRGKVWTTPIRFPDGMSVDQLIALPHALLFLADGSLYRIERSGGQPHRLLTPDQLGITDLAVSADTVYLLAGDDHRVYAVARDELGSRRLAKRDLRPYAGSSRPGFAGDGRAARKARFDAPTAIAATPDNTVYVADTGNHRIRKIDADGAVSTVAGGSVDPGCTAADAVGSYVGPIAHLTVRRDGSLLFTERSSQERMGIGDAQARLRELGPDGQLAELDLGFPAAGRVTAGPAGATYVTRAGTGEIYRLAGGVRGQPASGECRPLVRTNQVTSIALVSKEPASQLAALASGDIAYVPLPAGQQQPTAFADVDTVHLLDRKRPVFRAEPGARVVGIAPAGNQLLVWCDYRGDANGTVLYRVRRNGTAKPLVTGSATEADAKGLPLRGEGVTAAGFDPATDQTVVASGGATFELLDGELVELPWQGSYRRLAPGQDGRWLAHGSDGVVRFGAGGATEPVLPAQSNPPAPPSEVVPALTGDPGQQPDIWVTGFAVAADGAVYAAPRWDLSGLLLRVGAEGGTELVAGDGTAGPVRKTTTATDSIGRAVDVATRGNRVFLAGGAGIVRITLPEDADA